MDLYDEYICPKMSYPKMFKQKNYEEFAKYCNFLKITAYNENLYNLEKFTNIKRLELEGLGIEEIPVLPNLKDLAIENCMSIRNIPYMPKLRIIRPLHCHNLRNIEVKECSSEEMYILIGQCPKIEINNLYNIKYLSLYDLDHVTDIPINFKNNSLNIVHMDNLKSISYMIKNLRVRQCKEIDESIIMNLTKFGVNIESFKQYDSDTEEEYFNEYDSDTEEEEEEEEDEEIEEEEIEEEEIEEEEQEYAEIIFID